MNDVYRVSVEGGTPLEVAADRYTNEYFSSAAPDGTTLAITARASASAQWWRNGRSHLDEAEVWIVKGGATPAYEAVTSGGAKEMWPMWSADGRTLFYVSDRSGAQNIWTKGVGAGAAGVGGCGCAESGTSGGFGSCRMVFGMPFGNGSKASFIR